jgi:hypothetical protein
MPRRPSNVNQADVQRMIRAFQREKVPFRATLQPNGAAIFDTAIASNNEALPLEADDLAEDL